MSRNRGSKAKRSRKAPVVESLEPRILLSADLPGLDVPDLDASLNVDVDQVLSQAAAALQVVETDSDTGFNGIVQDTVAIDPVDEPDTVLPSSELPDDVRRELIIVDPSVPDYEVLLADVSAVGGGESRLDVVLIDPQRNGIEQITQLLLMRSDLDAIHLISHGSDGAIRIGGDTLDLALLQESPETFSEWGGALSAEGDILVYGCDVAATEVGQALVDTLAELTRADVAASTDLTGHESLGGDWELEYKAGVTEAGVAFSREMQDSWSSSLGLINVSTFDDVINGDTSSVANLIANDGGDGISLREAIIASNTDTAADEIVLSSGTYTLTIAGEYEDNAATGDLDIREDLTITGAGASATIVDANGVDRVFDVLNTAQWLATDITITGGDAGSDGGGVAITASATVTIRDSVVSGNTTTASGGGLSNQGTLALDRVRVTGNSAGNSGGGMLNSSITTITDSLLDANEAGNGAGAIWNESNNADLTVANSTISGNTSTVNSGGIYNENDATLRNVTITNNAGDSGGGLAEGPGNTTTSLVNSIIAGNTDTFGTPDVYGSFSSLGNNIIGDTVGASGFIGSDLQNTSPTLGALADNGGPTLTHALLAGSRGIDEGTNVGAPAADQRGTARDDGLVDIGAYELGSSTPPVISSPGGTYPYTENDGPVVLGDLATVTDVDSADFAGGQLVYQITANGLAEDRLDIRNQGTAAGEIGVSGSDITYGGVVIGTYTGATTGATALVASFNSSASVAAVEATLKNVTYENTSEDPTASTRTLQVYATDGDGGTSDTVTGYVAVTPVNDAPLNSNLVMTASTLPGSVSGPAAVASGDFNGDGFVDIVAGTLGDASDASLSWYRNDGSQNFVQQVITTAGMTADGVRTLDVADVDGDGDLDIVTVSENDDRIAWWRNDGLGNFTQNIASTSLDSPRSVVAVDFDGDGDMDILAGGGAVSGDTVHWLENNGAEVFTTHTVVTTAAAYHVTSLQVSDIDGDNDLDIVAAAYVSDAFLWFEHQGGGTFVTHTIDSGLTVDGAADVSIADVDGDGVEDVVTASQTSNVVSWYKNDGSGNFGVGPQWSVTANGARSVYAADLDNDGDADIIAGSTTDQTVVAHHNDGASSPGFSAQTISSGSAYPIDLNMGDIDGDADLDLLEAAYSPDDQVRWYENNGEFHASAETFEETPLSFSSTTGNAIRVSDADAGSNALQVTLTATDGTTTLSQTTGLTFSTGDGVADGGMTFAGAAADINAALDGLVFTPIPDFAGSANLQIETNDLGNSGAGGTLSDVDNIVITVIPVNDAPVISSPSGTYPYTEGAGAVVLGGSATVSDVDSADFDGGQLVYQITNNGLAEDRLDIRHQGAAAGQIGVSGTDITYGGVVIGTYTGVTTGGTPLVVSFNSSATVAAVEATLKNVTYENTSEDPTASTRTLQVYASDGDGGTSNTVTGYVAVTPVNDAPSNLSSGVQINTDGGNDAYLVDSASGMPYWHGFAGITMEFTVSELETPNSMSTLYSKKAAGSESYLAVHADGTLNWTGFTSTGQYSQLFDGGRHSVAFSWDAPNGELRFYVDGAFVELVSTPTQANTNGSGVFVLGQDQDAVEGGFDPDQHFAGTFHDVRVWDHVRSDADVADEFQYKLDLSSAEAVSRGLVANWQMDGFVAGEIVDIVNGYTLTIGHAADVGFSAGTAVDQPQVRENAANGTHVGFVLASDPDSTDNHSYLLTDDAAGRFAINAATGEITVADGSLLDFESAASHSVTVRVTDSGALTYDESLTINVANVDEPAEIGGDLAYSGNEGDAVSGTMAATDVDGLIDGTYFSVTSAATNGTAAIDAASGAWTFTPTDPNWFGSDSFEVTVTDDLGGTSTQVVSITLANVNDAPLARPDGVHLSFDGSDYIQVADHASLQMTNRVTMEAWINHDGTGTGSQVIVNKEGEYEMGITADTGEIIIAIAESGNTWAWHNTGYLVTASEWTHVAVTYDGLAGEARTYINGELVDTYAQSGVIGDVYPAFNDLFIGGRENATTQRFQGQIDEVRLWSATRTAGEIQSNMGGQLGGAEAGLVGNWRLDEVASGGVVDQSVFGNDGVLGGTEGAAATPGYQGYITDQNTVLNIPVGAGVLANDADVDSISLTVTNLNTTGMLGNLVLNTADGSFSYDPNGAFDYLDAGEQATETFTYTASDGSLDSNTVTATITITGVNDAPVTTPVTLAAIAEDSGARTITQAELLVNAGDVEGDSLTATGLTIGAGAGTLVDNGDGTWDYTPALNDDSSVSFSYSITDGLDTTAGSASLNITAVNDAPVFGGINTGTVTEDLDPDADKLLETTGTLTITDADAGESAFVADTVAGSHGTLIIDASGNWSYEANNTQASIQQLDAGESFNDVLTVSTLDGSSHNVTVTISGGDDASVVSGVTGGAVVEDGNLIANGTLSISDVDTSDNPVSFADEASTPGDNGYGDFRLQGGAWVYTLNNGHAAVQALGEGGRLTDTHTFMASDGSSQVVSVVISGAAEAVTPPVVEPILTELDPDPEERNQRPIEEAESPAEEEAPETEEATPPAGRTDPSAGSEPTVDDPLPGMNPAMPEPLQPDEVFLSVIADARTHDAQPIEKITAAVAKPGAESAQTFLQELKSVWQEGGSIGHIEMSDVRLNQAFLNGLDRMSNDLDESVQEHHRKTQLSAEAAAGVGISLTAGFVSWALRAGSLAASFLAAMPTWRHFDPMPILAAEDQAKKDAASGEEEGDADKKVDELFGRQ